MDVCEERVFDSKHLVQKEQYPYVHVCVETGQKCDDGLHTDKKGMKKTGCWT